MKKILPLLAGFALASLGFFIWNRLKAKDLLQKDESICSNYSAGPVNQMEKQEVLSMIRNYHQNQYAAINSSSSTGQKLVYFPQNPNVSQDSRAVFFSLDTLKRLIYFIEKASAQFSQQDKDNLGINIYFASYPKSMGMVKHNYDYTNRHTLVMIPSVFDNTRTMARDFDLTRNLSGANPFTPSYIDSAFLSNPANLYIPGAAVHRSSQTVTPSPNTMNSQNHGTGTPPPYSLDPTTGFYTGNVILDLTDPN